MIVRCPECSTGFKLPDEQVTEKGVKLRCSKCSHVFRIRLAEDGETEFFYNDGDREQNEALAAGEDAEGGDEDRPADADDNEWTDGESTKLGKPMAAPGSPSADDDDAPADAEDGNKTQFGMPSKQDATSKNARKPSKSASSNYNPFPHANLDLKPSKESAIGGSGESEDAPDEEPASESQADASSQEEDLDWGDEATRVDEDAFGGAFDDEPAQDDPFGDAFADEDAQPAAAQAPVATKAPPAAQAPPATQAPPAVTNSAPAAAAQAAAVGAQAGAKPAAPKPQGAQPNKDSDFWAQKDSAYSPEEMVDPSFGQDGPAFDPEQGVVDNKPATNQPASNQPAQNQRAAGPPAGATSSSAQSDQHAQPASKPAPAAQPKAASQAKPRQNQSTQSQDVQNDGGWDVDMLDEPIAPHTVGGSGLQKVANFALIALIVGVGFLGVVAGLSGGILDLERFPHMLEVAFEGAEFEPREEWVEKSAPAPAPAPEDPVRFEGVFATPTSVGKSDQVILLRGNAKNVADVDYSDVVVRGILYDKNERVIAQTTAPLGSRVLQSQIAEAGSADKAKGLLPESAKLLSSRSTEPFSLIFTNLPPKVFEDQDVIYRVEIADKKSTGDAAAAADSN